MFTNKATLALTKIAKHKYTPHLLAILVFLAIIFYYMTPPILNCTDTLYGFGDNTGGPIWRHNVSPQSPLWGFQNFSNFPEGENLYSPVNWSGAGQYVVFWIFAKLAGPVCGYNLLNILSLLFTSTVTYGLVYWLYRRKTIALFAGYALTFSPYTQVKIGGHPSYAFAGLFISIIWLFLSLIKKPTIIKSLGLGILIGSLVYFDPYFVLYGVIIVAVLLLSWLIVKIIIKYQRASILSPKTLISFKIQAKYLLISLIAAILVVFPMATIAFFSGSAIQEEVASVRGNVLAEARACSNYPHEYLLPFVLHPLPDIAGVAAKYELVENKLKNNFSCGIGEDTVGISLALILLISLTAIIVIWEKLNKRKISGKLKYKYVFILVFSITLLIAGISIGLPPVELFNKIPTPTFLLLEITQTWRTLSRAFIIVNISIILLASAAIAYYAHNTKINPIIKKVAFAILLLAIIIEYQAFMPFRGNELSTFSFRQDTPQIYKDLKVITDIGSIAEYPIESFGESDAPSYYQTMQNVHGKPMLNSPSPLSSLEPVRKSIKNLSDPQTLPALATLGLDAIVVHGATQEDYDKFPRSSISGLYKQSNFNILPHSGLVKNDQSFILKLNDYKREKVDIGILSKGFYRNLGLINNSFDWAYEAINGAEIKIMTISKGEILEKNTTTPYCFSIRSSAPGQTVIFYPVIDGVRGNSVLVNNSYTNIQLNVKSSIILENNAKANMQITNLGCSS